MATEGEILGLKGKYGPKVCGVKQDLFCSDLNISSGWENGLAVPRKVKYGVTMWPRNSTPRSTPKRTENACSHGNWSTRSNIIHDREKEEAIQCVSTYEQIHTMWSVGTIKSYLIIKKTWGIDTCYPWMNSGKITLIESRQTQKAT